MMSSKPSGPKRPSPPPSRPRSRSQVDSRRAPTLDSLRAEIDRIDKDLVGLLNRRAEVAAQIGQVKERNGFEVWSPAREEEVVNKVLDHSKGPLPPETIRLIYRELMSGSRSIQRTMRVACLGPKYSYSHLASIAKFGNAVEHVPVGSISAVFEEVNRRHVQFGIVPLENSTDGRVADTLEMFVRLSSLKIRAEVKLRVHHCLIGRCARADVRRVYSRAQALSQCRHWIGKNLPQAALVEVVSTAHAAEIVQHEDLAAAIASRAAADAYGLSVLVENIEDQPYNVTRFAVIAEQSEKKTGRDKTTVLLRLLNQSGALSKVLGPFEKAGLNLTMIESFPAHDSTPGRNPSYLFFIDIEGHADDPKVARTIELVRKRCERLEIIGSYPRGDSVES
jgi:chorismate mutase / prephenate dehydratase